MKKTKIMVLCLVAVIMILSLLACQGQTKLEAPAELSVTEDNILHWRTVDGASSYIVVVDGIEQPKTISTQFDLNNLELQIGQKITIKVKAIGDGYVYLNSEDSESLTFEYNEGGSDPTINKPEVETEEPDDESESEISNNSEIKNKEEIDLYVCQGIDKPVLMDKCTDGSCNYYLFYIGSMQGLPLVKSSPIKHEGVRNEYEITCYAETSQTIQQTITRHVDVTLSESHKVTVGAEIDTFFGGVSVESEKSWEESITTGRESSNSVANTTLSAVTNSTKLSLEPGDPFGYYRYIAYTKGTDVYVVAYYDLEKKEFLDYNYITYSDPETVRKWEYSVDGNFERDNQQNKLKFDVNVLSEINLNETLEVRGLESGIKIPNKKVETTILKNTNPQSVKITDYGHYGYGCAKNKRDAIQLSQFSKYFSEDYLFCFDVVIQIREIDDGYQQIFLYNKENDPSGTELTIHELKQDKGLIGGVTIEHKPGKTDKTMGTYNFTWYFSGKEMANVLYLCYDAHGDYEDDWYKDSIKVDLTVVEAQYDDPARKVVLSNNVPVEVTDNGSYGVSGTRKKELIELEEAYTDCADDQHIFVFDVNLSMHEKNDGYQEIYMYNELVTTGVSSLSQALEKGMVGALEISHELGSAGTTSETYSTTWCVSGKNINSEMYIHYDAHGGGEDDWCKDSIEIKVKVFTVPQIMETADNIQMFYFCE